MREFSLKALIQCLAAMQAERSGSGDDDGAIRLQSRLTAFDIQDLELIFGLRLSFPF